MTFQRGLQPEYFLNFSVPSIRYLILMGTINSKFGTQVGLSPFERTRLLMLRASVENSSLAKSFA